MSKAEERKGEALSYQIMTLRERVDILQMLIDAADEEINSVAKLSGLAILRAGKLRHVVHQICEVREAVNKVDETFETLAIAP